MRIAVLSVGDSHTAKWVRSLLERGHDVHLITMEIIEDYAGVKVHRLPLGKPWGYCLNGWPLRRLMRGLKPDILHAHYASGYGTLGRLANYHPCVLSVWGSDVFEFPYQSDFNRKLIERNLRHYDHICSTSSVMADQVLKLDAGLSRPTVTPFGVDTTRFCPNPELRGKDTLTIGTVKSLEKYYGIDVLIEAFAAARGMLNGSPALRLLLVGEGSQAATMKNLAESLGISDAVEFVGYVPHPDVPAYINKIDVFVNASRAESFGVAVLEASACGVPVITTDVGGLPEVMIDGVTGIQIPADDADSLCKAILALARDAGLRRQLGDGGRKFARERYEWQDCVTGMERVYSELLSKGGGKPG